MGPADAKQTPLYQAHLRLGAKIVDFGGWLMPISYPTGILAEHHATRNAVGVFDVCHMGEIHFQGPRAAEAVQRLVVSDVGALVDGRALYTVACRPDGGIVDDLIVYRLHPDHFLLVVNASNIAKDRDWFVQQAGKLCQIRDDSPQTGLIAFQGPRAAELLAPLVSAPITGLPSYNFLGDATVAGKTALVLRTGYTGEDGFEICCAARDAEAIWTALLEVAGPVGGGPVGLGARDTLRLEARLSLYGNDLSEETSPLEAGLGRLVKPAAGDFIGREALMRQQQEGVKKRLVGFVMQGRGIPRHGYPLHADGPGGERIGEVTSGSVGPTVGKNIGLGYVRVSPGEPADLAGTRLQVDCRGKMIPAEITKGPFYRRKAA